MLEFNKKAISSLIAVVLIILVGTVIVTILLNWSKGYSQDNLSKVEKIGSNTETSSFLVFDRIIDKQIFLKNLNPSKNDINIESYKILSSENKSAVNMKIDINETHFSYGDSNKINILCKPSKKYELLLYSTDNKIYKVNVSDSLFAGCGDCICSDSESGSTCPEDCLGTCGDDSCSGDENAQTCPADCTVCGDDLCTGDENIETCLEDCGFCGDDLCTGDENAETCSEDCGLCGNGVWNEGEDPFNCPADCSYTLVDDCNTLDSSDTYYILSQDISNTDEYCINITADNIIFDLNNHTITSEYSPGRGDTIRLSDVNNVSIQNGGVKNLTYGCSAAIGLYNSEYCDFNNLEFRNVNITDTYYIDGREKGFYYGVYLDNSHSNDFTNLHFEDINSYTDIAAYKSYAKVYPFYLLNSTNNNFSSIVAKDLNAFNSYGPSTNSLWQFGGMFFAKLDSSNYNTFKDINFSDFFVATEDNHSAGAYKLQYSGNNLIDGMNVYDGNLMVNHSSSPHRYLGYQTTYLIYSQDNTFRNIDVNNISYYTSPDSYSGYYPDIGHTGVVCMRSDSTQTKNNLFEGISVKNMYAESTSGSIYIYGIYLDNTYSGSNNNIFKDINFSDFNAGSASYSQGLCLYGPDNYFENISNLEGRTNALYYYSTYDQNTDSKLNTGWWPDLTSTHATSSGDLHKYSPSNPTYKYWYNNQE